MYKNRWHHCNVLYKKWLHHHNKSCTKSHRKVSIWLHHRSNDIIIVCDVQKKWHHQNLCSTTKRYNIIKVWVVQKVMTSSQYVLYKKFWNYNYKYCVILSQPFIETKWICSYNLLQCLSMFINFWLYFCFTQYNLLLRC